MRRLAVILLSLVLALPAQSATVAGVTLPDSFPMGGQNLVLNGIGVRTVTFLAVKAYVAGLYLPQRSSDARSILSSPGTKVLMMQFLHSASKSQVEAQYRDGEKKNCGHGECNKADETDFERLVAATPGAEVGDTLTYIYGPKGVRALFNNRQIADIANPDLARQLLAGFIGAAPPSEDLRQHLLGAKTN